MALAAADAATPNYAANHGRVSDFASPRRPLLNFRVRRQFLYLPQRAMASVEDGIHSSQITIAPRLNRDLSSLPKPLSAIDFSSSASNGKKVRVAYQIESRPQKLRPLRVVDDSNRASPTYFDYLFYIDFEASMAEPRAQFALGHLQEFARFLRVLGCYPIDTVS
ncbi:arogenate/prephenate dehydratase [Striga asiatica]|uniref:Arogenate/prephenate dehydratase n=1 Tax=Striga asiatica TaxID=4170 RepID=A0A5A7QTF3_STRAF|nr:arogenate/prephenate dehydratase [Striga asiatica]